MNNLGKALILLAGLMPTVLAAPLAAQRELVTVSLEPDRTDWLWQDYAERVSEAFRREIEARVREGLADDRREFVADSSAARLRFAIRIGPDGGLEHLGQIAPRYRFIAYLVQRSAARAVPFAALPDDFPVFYLDGIITFECRFRPTRWYKKLYFEQPLDSLELPQRAPLVREQSSTRRQPLVLYEPDIPDKQMLLTEFKRRIGAAGEITDTSSYSPLDLNGRRILVRVPYDSLNLDPAESLILKNRLATALETAGAVVTERDYDPERIRRENERADSIAAAEDSLARLAAMASAVEDTTASDTTAAVADTAGRDTASMAGRFAVGQLNAAPPERDLTAAFDRVFQEPFLVLDAGLAPDSAAQDSAVCRLRLYPGGAPDNLKRRVDYRFALDSSLPDSLGAKLVRRLTDPPARPRPPAPPAQSMPADADTVAADTSAADTTATDTSAADTLSAGEAQVDPSPAAADTAKVSTPADTLAPGEQPEQSPAQDTTAAAEPATDTSGTGAQPAPADTVSTANDTTDAAPQDTVSGNSPE